MVFGNNVTIMTAEYLETSVTRGDNIVKHCRNAHIFPTGRVEATESIKITATNVFKGEGILKAPRITLDVGEFKFTGTIHCTGKCLITSKKAFDASMFKREGGGNFEIRMPSQEVSTATQAASAVAAPHVAKPAAVSVAKPPAASHEEKPVSTPASAVSKQATDSAPQPKGAAPKIDPDFMPGLKRNFFNNS